MNKRVIIVLLTLFSTWVQAQNSITLEACRDSAVLQYPLTRQSFLLDQANELKLKNLNKNYLPSMALNGQASYQSAVTKVPIQNLPISGIEELDKDWYKVTLDVNQIIYDGGVTKYQKVVEESNLEIDKQNVEVELFKLKERINNLYFSVLLIKENKQVLQIHKETLEARLKDVQSAIDNGVLLASNGDVLKAEIITIEQAIDEAEISISATIQVLNHFTGLALSEQTTFIKPEVSITLEQPNINRPEYTLMSMQQQKLDASKDLTLSRNLPKFSAFGQAGYGRPGFDMLKNEFTDFYIVGARLNWNFYDWSKGRKEREILDLQNQIIDTQKETFTKNLNADLTNKQAEINKIVQKIARDRELITLREKITASASSQLENGTITSSDYLIELNAESKAKLDLQTHEIQLIKAKTDYLTATGNL